MESNLFKLNLDEVQKNTEKVFGRDNKFSFDLESLHKDSKCLVSDNLTSLECLSVIRNKSVKHVLQNSIQSLDDKLDKLKDIFFSNEKYFEENFRLLSGVSYVQVFNIQSDRYDIVDETFSKMSSFSENIKDQSLKQVTTELIMNAQIDAPKISGNKSTKDSILVLEKDDSKGLFAISVIDYYGSLDCYKMLENIYAAHKNGYHNAMSQNSIGAGLGGAMMYELADSLYIGAIPNQVSRVSVVLPYRVSERKIDHIQKSIHLIKEE